MKQTIYVICETRDAYASFIGITDALKVMDGETPKKLAIASSVVYDGIRLWKESSEAQNRYDVRKF